MFVNRMNELAALERWWGGSRSRMALVWGRRRVGKTALVRRFAEGRRTVWHTGAGRGMSSELSILSGQVAGLGAGGLRDLLSRGYVDWDDALDHLASIAESEPLLLVLDEFPELAAATPELPNLLRAFLDRSENLTRLRILICGSAVRYMEDLMESRQPLYGRMDLTLPVHPFAPWEAALMLPDLSPVDRATVYGILGGIPMYLGWWEQAASVEENLHVLAGEPGARLVTEGELVLATEAESGDQARAALHAIAAGATRHNEVRNVIGTDPTPVLALDDHQGARWEAAFRQHVRRMATSGELGDRIVAVGPYWTADGHNEIDVVALAGRSRTPVLVGEAKWARRVAAPRLVAGLLGKAPAVPGMVEEPQVLLCAREQVTQVPDGVRTITAADIFA